LIIYNVTIKIDTRVKDEWLKWMKDHHIPEVIDTGLFQGHKICRLLDQDESEGVTYSIQYFCKSMTEYNTYQEKFAPKLQQEHQAKYNNRFVAFKL